MTDLLERTHREPVVDHRLPTVTGPPKGPPRVEVDISKPWPLSARIVAIALLIVAIVGAFGSMIRSGQVERAQLVTEQPDALTESNLAPQSEPIATDERIDTLVADLVERDADVAALTGRNVQLLLAAEAVTAERDDAILRRNVLAGELATQVEQTATVTAERDALEEVAALFPMTFDATLTGVDLVGTYDIVWDQIFCDGVTNCGTLPGDTTATITANDAGWLTISIDDIVTATLDRTDGSLSAVVDNTTAASPIGPNARTSRVAITISAHGLTIDDEGTRHVDDLGASIVVIPAATGTFPAGLVIYGLTLTPR